MKVKVIANISVGGNPKRHPCKLQPTDKNGKPSPPPPKKILTFPFRLQQSDLWLHLFFELC